MSGIWISTMRAARELQVHPATLQEWCERFGFPGTAVIDGRRAFDRREIEVLGGMLGAHSTVAAAIRCAQATLEHDDAAVRDHRQ